MTMTEHKPFTQLYDEVKMLSDVRKAEDRRATLNRYVFRAPSDSSRAEFLMLPAEEDTRRIGSFATGEHMQLTDHAYRQLLTRLKFPHQLAGRLPAGALFNDINWLMQQDAVTDKGDDRLTMLRTVARPEGGREIRALLGARYNPADDLEVLTYAAPWLENAEVVYESITETDTVISVTWPDRFRDPDLNPGTDLGIAPAIQILNSEVGTRSVKLVSAVFRARCGNILPGYYTGGAGDRDEVGNDGVRRVRYQGKGYTVTAANVVHGQGRSHRMIHVRNPERLEAFVRDAMEDLSTSYDAAVARWRDGLLQHINNPIDAMEAVAGAASLSEKQFRAALDAWAETRPDFGPNVTGIANAFTLGAQEFSTDPTARTDMERAGALAFSLSSN
jgi:hypothetical protein